VPGFLDPDDPVLFPRLTTAQIGELAARGETGSLSPGDVLFEQAQRDTPFFVVLEGAIDVIDRQPDGDRYFTQCHPGTFAADISMFTGEPTLARGVIAEESSILVLPPDELRAVVAVLQTLSDPTKRAIERADEDAGGDEEEETDLFHAMVHLSGRRIVGGDGQVRGHAERGRHEAGNQPAVPCGKRDRRDVDEDRNVLAERAAEHNSGERRRHGHENGHENVHGPMPAGSDH